MLTPRDTLKDEVQLKLKQSETHKKELTEAQNQCGLLRLQLEHMQRPLVSQSVSLCMMSRLLLSTEACVMTPKGAGCSLLFAACHCEGSISPMSRQ